MDEKRWKNAGEPGKNEFVKSIPEKDINLIRSHYTYLRRVGWVLRIHPQMARRWRNENFHQRDFFRRPLHPLHNQVLLMILSNYIRTNASARISDLALVVFYYVNVVNGVEANYFKLNKNYLAWLNVPGNFLFNQSRFATGSSRHNESFYEIVQSDNKFNI